MKTFIYSLIVFVCVGLGVLLYGNLQDTARKQKSQQQFEQRKASMLNDSPGSLRHSSPTWKQLTQQQQLRLKRVGFQPASLAGATSLEFKAEKLGGKTIQISTYQNHWLLLNFWATWCAPCRFEMPSLQQLHRSFEEEPFAVIGINLQEPEESIKPFVRRTNLRFPIWMDKRGTIADYFFVTGVPETWLIAPGNRPVARLIGSRDWNDQQVLRVVESLLSTNLSH